MVALAFILILGAFGFAIVGVIIATKFLQKYLFTSLQRQKMDSFASPSPTHGWEEKEQIPEKKFVSPYPSEYIWPYFGGSLLLGGLLDLFLIHTAGYTVGISVFLFQLAYSLFLYGAFLHKKRLPLPVAVAFCFGFLLSFWFAIFSNETLRIVNSILLICLNLFLTLYISGWIASFWYTFSSLATMAATPFIVLGNLGQSFSLLRKTGCMPKIKNLTTILWSVCLLCLLLLVIIPLLSSDVIFSKVLDTYLWNPLGTIRISGVFWRVVVSIGCGILFWSMLCTLQQKDMAPTRRDALPPYPIKKIMIGIILGGLVLVYILFVCIQFKYLFFGSHELILSMNLPSYAAYVHRGFYELMVVAAINVGLFAVFHFSRDVYKQARAQGISFLLLLLMVCTIIISFSALRRIRLYVGAYGLSQLRVFVMYGMLLAIAIEAFCFVKVFFPDLKYGAFFFYAFLSSFTLLCYSNIDKQIAQFNIAHYQFVSQQYDDENYEKRGSLRKAQQLDARYILLSLSNDAIDEKLFILATYPTEKTKYASLITTGPSKPRLYSTWYDTYAGQKKETYKDKEKENWDKTKNEWKKIAE